jgi:tol-pal system protein YbgF
LPAPAVAQRQQATPEQRIQRLERQVGEMQRQVYPRGRPADTAGFSDDPAATQSSVAALDQRLDALERQMADMLRQSEENGHRLQSIEADLTRVRTEQEQRITALEQRAAEPAAATPVGPQTVPEPSARPSTTKPPKGSSRSEASTPASTTATAAATPQSDPGEDAYTAGYKAWEAGDYDQAITSLKAFTSAYPKHRRVSYANNLIGRAMLSKGDARGAAAVFLSNYRGNPAGERAPDSLYFLGQSLTKLGQTGQACKAYQEIDAVYGAKLRADLKKQVAEAKSQAQCS